MTKRTIPTPANGMKVPSGVHAMRRGGARREVTERVTLQDEKQKVFEGWALNVSRGGLRVILEEKVSLGQKFSIGIGSDEVLQRSGRVVWVQEEPDGVIVGLEFTSLSGVHSSAPPPPHVAPDGAPVVSGVSGASGASVVSVMSQPVSPDDATERSTFEPEPDPNAD